MCSAGQRSRATVLWGSPDCPARAAARAFGPGATNPRATTDGGQHFFQAGKRCHSPRAGGRRLCNTTGLNFATTGIPGLPSTCRTQHVPSAQVLLTPVLRLTAGSTSSRQEEGVTPSGREGGVYVTPVVTGWPPLQSLGQEDHPSCGRSDAMRGHGHLRTAESHFLPPPYHTAGQLLTNHSAAVVSVQCRCYWIATRSITEPKGIRIPGLHQLSAWLGAGARV